MLAGGAERERTEGWDQGAIEKLIGELWGLRAGMVAYEAAVVPRLGAIAPHFAASGRNLAHYLALRRIDIRPLQERLAWIGVSSLGRAETHVLANLDKALGILHRLADRPWTPHIGDEPVGFNRGRALLEPSRRGPARADAGRARRPRHGHAADRGGDRLRSRAAAGRCGHGYRAHQLRPRRCAGVEGNGGARAACRGLARAAGARPDGPRRAEAAHRPDRARPAGAQAAGRHATTTGG